ncbi:MAG: acyl-CoA thioesterase [Balneolales bacterium]|nr:acyl-CoA thioesterase [Balneolales bacterium]
MNISSQSGENEPLYQFSLQLRSRYSETDQMGYVYHGRFLEYFEQTRTEMIRSVGIPYKVLEDAGAMMPVAKASIEFFRPVFYDELITIKVMLFEQPGTRLNTYYNVYGDNGKLKVTGYVQLCFVSAETRKPCDPPAVFLEKIEQLKINHPKKDE